MDPFVGEIRAFGFNFAPRNWVVCAGQLMAISQNTALYSLLGTNFGGDGRTSFGLPNLQGRAVVGAGQGNGLSNYPVGQSGGSASVTLLLTQLPAHVHTLPLATTVTNATAAPSPTVVLGGAGGGGHHGGTTYSWYVSPQVQAQSPTTMNQGAVLPTGGSQPHNNMQPYLTVNYSISLSGVFPQRP